MIVDTLSGSGRYDALHPRFKKAFDYAVARMDTLAPGKYAIDGDDLYIVISEGLLRPEQEGSSRSARSVHRRTDPAPGSGRRAVRMASARTVYSAPERIRRSGRYCFFDDKPSCYVSLHPGEFVVFSRKTRTPADRQRQCPESDPEDPGCVRAGVRYSKRRTIACFSALGR